MTDQLNQPLDCLMLPGLHGTEDLYAPLIKEVEKRAAKKDLELNLKALSYPTNIKQNYGSLIEWLEQENRLCRYR